MSVEELEGHVRQLLATLIDWATSPQFYAQVAAIIVAVGLALIASRKVRVLVPLFNTEPESGPLLRVRQAVYACRDLFYPVIAVLTLAIAVQATTAAVGASWLVRIAQSVGVVAVLYTAISRFIKHPLLRTAGLYVGIPVAALQVFGWLDDAATWLDRLSIQAGNIRFSVLALIKAGLFGSILFWLGRISNDAGQKVIRKQEALDLPTRELFAKLFQIALFCTGFVLLLQLLGLDLTALAIFGGALGVGIGFGLQQIAANFISGIIILIERALKVGDYIEMDGAKAGVLKELNMRSSTLATFDGKEILVPNEKLITTSFINWTKSGTHQRHEVTFQVGHDSDMHEVQKLTTNAAASHPDVLGDPEAPICQLRAIGDKGLSLAVEFWVDGVAGGPHKVPSEVRLRIWEALRASKVPLPRA